MVRALPFIEVIALSPPLCITEADCDEAIDRFAAALEGATPALARLSADRHRPARGPTPLRGSTRSGPDALRGELLPRAAERVHDGGVTVERPVAEVAFAGASFAPAREAGTRAPFAARPTIPRSCVAAAAGSRDRGRRLGPGSARAPIRPAARLALDRRSIPEAGARTAAPTRNALPSRACTVVTPAPNRDAEGKDVADP